MTATGAGAIGLLVLAMALGQGSGIAGAITLLIAAYAIGLWSAGADALAPFVACALLLSAELAHWSIDARLPARDDAGVHVLRGVALAAVAAGALACSSLVGIIATVIAPVTDVGQIVLGTIAATAALGAIGFLIVRLVRPGPPPASVVGGRVADR